MDIKHIKYVATIAETKNFSEAAKCLYISQPALSQCINRLEKELGVLLFERTKSKVSLSEAGKLFLKDGIPILNAAENLKHKMLELSASLSYKLKVGVSQFYGKYFLPTTIPIFNKSHPNSNIEIIEDESTLLEKKLITNQIDLAIIPLPIFSSKIKYDILCKEKIKFAICSSNCKLQEFLSTWDKRTSIDVSIFKNEPFVALTKGFKMRSILEFICNEFNFKPKIVLETKNLDTVNSLVSNNYGLSFLPSLISKYNNVNYFDIDSKYSSRSIVAAYDSNKYVPQKIFDFVSILKKVLSEINTI
jgi:LysR family hydrogen peroxide-inducible transcriptional activator